MILIDTGPLVALIDKGQDVYARCAAVIEPLKGSLLTTWPCLTEAMYFLGQICGWSGQETLWEYVENRELLLDVPPADEWKRVKKLMEQYSDTPMDLADASLVTLAERRRLKRILTLDSDFYVYRINNKDPFEILSL